MQKSSILVADPNLITLERMNEVLKAAGYKPVLVSRLQAVPHLARELRPQVVVVTLDSDPAGEGRTILHELQTNPETADTAVIFVVGPRRPLWRFAGYRVGERILFLMQPVLPDQLVEAVGCLLLATGARTNLGMRP